MKLDVIIATRNRCMLLESALASLLGADIPAGLQVAITVVDNNSSDQTEVSVRRIAGSTALPVRYVFEARPGKPFALNTGIASTNGDLVGFIDDDERVNSSWFTQIAEAFRDPAVDFIGGPYLPEWSVPPPKWLPRQAAGVIGCFAFSSTPQKYGNELPAAVLFGGNAVLRRAVLDRVGPYRTDMAGHEDQEMFDRLLAGGFEGIYLPHLVIHHWIPEHRLQKRYFRNWMWRAGAFYARMHERDDHIRKAFGVPLYLARKIVRSVVQMCWRSIHLAPQSSRFESELDAISSLSLAIAYFRMRKNAAQMSLKQNVLVAPRK